MRGDFLMYTWDGQSDKYERKKVLVRLASRIQENTEKINETFVN